MALFFKSTAVPGYSRTVETDPRRVIARKREREAQVHFTPIACRVQSQEGLVHAKPGDAILTGTRGEKWRVSRERFAEKYRPAPATLAGQDGAYISNPIPVLGLQLSEPFEVLLADGKSTLSGRSGDWLVDYGDGSLGIVSQAIFAATYDIVS